MNNIIDSTRSTASPCTGWCSTTPAGLLAVAFALGFFELVPPDPAALAFSVALITAVCWATNRLFAHRPAGAGEYGIGLYHGAHSRPDPAARSRATDLMGVGGLILRQRGGDRLEIRAGDLPQAHLQSGRHRGRGVRLGSGPAGDLVGGRKSHALAVRSASAASWSARKVQRFDMVGAYILANLAVDLSHHGPRPVRRGAWRSRCIYSPLLFAGFAMLTEPLTAPQAKGARIAYGAMVGALCAPSLHLGDFYLTPEIALLLGNVFAYAVSPKGRFRLTLVRIEQLTAGCHDFIFKPDRKLDFRPGNISIGRSMCASRTIAATAARSPSPRRPTEQRGAAGGEVLRRAECLQAVAAGHAAGRRDLWVAAGRRLHAAEGPRHQARLHRRRHRRSRRSAAWCRT